LTTISVVTVCFNSAKSIRDTLRSVAAQSGADYEHIIVDGASTDDTMAIVRDREFTRVRSVSEADNGIYDAMNKGVALATGELIGFLNSDDRYADAHVLAEVVAAYESSHCDFVYGNLQMVNAQGRVVRNWKTGSIPPQGLTGTQIPHPALFVSRQLLGKIQPPFDPSYRISADLKQQLIFINKMRARGTYLPRPLALMRLGGASTQGLSGYLLGWRESARAYNEVFGKGGCWYTLRKVVSKAKGIRRIR
jgi:glycosyltransferase involved in cell wall biosynthesis